MKFRPYGLYKLLDVIDSLEYNRHLVDQVLCIRDLVHDEQHVTSIQIDTSLQVFLEINITGHSLGVSVKCGSDQLTVTIDHRRTGVTTCNIIVRDEVHGNVVSTVTSEILCVIQIFQILRYFELATFRAFFFHNTG